MITKNDFVELDFTAIVKETNIVFDTSDLQIAKKNGLFQEGEEEKFKPIKLCIGQGMVIKGLDKALEGKEIGKEYEIDIPSKEAFGERNPNLIKIVSINSFREKGVEPTPGLVLALDNVLVRIAAVSGGRVIVDFNNPLSGKEVIYKIKIRKKIENNKEKISSLCNFFIGQEADIEIKENKTEVLLKDKISQAVEKELKKKIKELVGIEVEFKNIGGKNNFS